MGVVYHGHYLVYFELGRTELLRSLGATYRAVEEEGTLLFVVETGLQFHHPAQYDDLLTVRTHLVQIRGVRLRFEYEVWREDRRLTSGFTVLAACDQSGRPRRIPGRLAALMKPGVAAAGPAGQAGKDRMTGAATAVQGGSPTASGGVASPSSDSGSGPGEGDA